MRLSPWFGTPSALVGLLLISLLAFAPLPLSVTAVSGSGFSTSSTLATAALVAGLRPALALPSVRAQVPPARTPRPGWGWPLAGEPTVTRRFANPPQPWRPGHRGVDLAGTVGADVRAAAAGVVAFSGVIAGRGVVSVDHAGGLRTTYEPVTALVKAGDPVRLGETIATLDAGHAGCPGPACLHWGLRRDDVYLDPLLVVRPPRLRLKPLTG
jgi:murein DD-endopeptidase MepM/ murein hydrolase activator NlpD